MSEAADFARKQPAKQFYIAARTASLLIGNIMQGTSLDKLNHLSRKRITMLYDMYTDYLKQHPDNKLTRERILEELVERPAPEFFLSQGRAKHIIMYERRKVRKRMGL